MDIFLASHNSVHSPKHQQGKLMIHINQLLLGAYAQR